MNATNLINLIRLSALISLVSLFSFNVLPFSLVPVILAGTAFGILESLIQAYCKTTSLPAHISGQLNRWSQAAQHEKTRRAA